jgi:hypothetical protein
VTNEFPPKTNHEAEVVAMLEVLSSVVATRKAVYVSIPITSGRRYIEWYTQNQSKPNFKENGSHQDFVVNVIDYNRKQSKQIITNLKKFFSDILINPTTMIDIKGWEQNDYRDMWGRVIERYARTVVCTDGWNFSSGCSYEFLVAKTSKIKTVDENNKYISIEQGIKQIEQAVADIELCKLSTEFLKSVSTALIALPKDKENYAGNAEYSTK